MLMFFHSYCFFTGSGPDKVAEHSDLILRSHSASSIEDSFPPVILLRSGTAHIVQVHRLRCLGRMDVCRRRLRMTRFSAVGRLRPQDHRCAVSPPHLRHPFYSDYSIALPSPLLSSPRIAFSASHENRPRDAATNNDCSIALTLSLFLLHVPSSSQDQRSAWHPRRFWRDCMIIMWKTKGVG